MVLSKSLEHCKRNNILHSMRKIKYLLKLIKYSSVGVRRIQITSYKISI